MRKHLIRAVMHPWWRLSRGMTLGVRGVVSDADGRVLLVRHSYIGGWHLPGGGVERGETMGAALARELMEETNVLLLSPPRLHGIYSNEDAFPGDHVAVFVASEWRQEDRKHIGAEIIAARFFPVGALPDGATEGTRRRLAEIFGGAAAIETW